jgi:hypothetical protein
VLSKAPPTGPGGGAFFWSRQSAPLSAGTRRVEPLPPSYGQGPYHDTICRAARWACSCDRPRSLTACRPRADRPHGFVRATSLDGLLTPEACVDLAIGPDACGKEIYLLLTILTRIKGEQMSSDVIAAAVAATVLWVVSVGSFLMETPKRPTGEAWVVTASEKIASRPALVRANVPFKTAAR